MGNAQLVRRLKGIASVALVLVCGVVGAGLAAPSVVSAAPGATTCRAVQVPVTVGDQRGPISGTLCAPPGATAVQVLVHGWTYDRNYFDFPYQRETYSYAQAANRAGYATLAIDRLGAGASLRPVSVFNTFPANVKAVHTVVQALRGGGLGTKYQRVIAVGHSLGSVTIAHEAGQYKDVEAIITTGFAHAINYLPVFAQILGRSYLARTDPKFAGSISDPLYATTMPGTRQSFYAAKNADPAIIAMDERLKAADSLVDVATAVPYNLVNVDRELNIPVLVVDGSEDHLFCGLGAVTCDSDQSLVEHEKPWYGPKAKIEGMLVPGSGHDVQLEKTAPLATKRMLAFSDKHIGNGTGQTNTTPGVRPHIPAPPATPVSPLDKQVAAVFTKALLPVINEYQKAADITPGLGDSRNPIPSELTTRLLSTIGNTNHRVLGTLPNEILANL